MASKKPFKERIVAYQAARDAGHVKLAKYLRDEVIVENMALVNKIAKKYHTGKNCTFSDLLQAGSIGVMKALESYDPNKGAFSTHCHWFIRNQIRAVVDATSDGLRKGEGIPVKNAQYAASFYAKTGRDPSLEERGVSQKVLDRWMQKRFYRSMQDPIRNQEDDSACETVQDLMVSEQASPESVLLKKEFNAQLVLAISRLQPDRRRVLEAMVLEEKNVRTVARELGRSVSSVWKIRESALLRIKSWLSDAGSN